METRAGKIVQLMSTGNQDDYKIALELMSREKFYMYALEYMREIIFRRLPNQDSAVYMVGHKGIRIVNRNWR